MLFNSLQFLLFFPLVLLVYQFIPAKAKCIWLLLCSYYFYMCWNTKYGFLEDSLPDETRSWESVDDDEKKKLMDQFFTVQTIKLQECLVESRGYCYYEDKWEADGEVIYGKMGLS